MHPAKTIIDFYKSKFAEILNISNPVAGTGNSTVVGLSVVSSGKYSSTVSRVYTVEVITGGELGVAVCSIDDNLDGIYSNIVIANGIEIDLGSHGAKIKFDVFDPEYEFSLGDKWVITCNHKYNYSVKEVKNARLNPQLFNNLPGIAFTSASGLKYNQSGTSNNNTVTMGMNVDMWFNVPVDNDIESYLFEAIEDIETAITEDPQCGNNIAEDIEIYECTPYLPVPGEPIAAISVDFGVRFYRKI